MRKRIADYIIHRFSKPTPNLQIGGADNPYLNRWYLIRRNNFFNIYLHQFIRNDDDRAEHDHPWWSLSWMMRGVLWEQRDGEFRPIAEGELIFRRAASKHRLEVVMPYETWTLFITGPKLREWGFHCPNGWVHWLDFTGGARGETIGRGCGEP